MALNEEQIFENEVRRIASVLWPSNRTGGALKLDGLERDALYETEECIHLIECTVSRGQQKAKDDTRKLDSGAETLRKSHPDKGIKTWFVTRHDPTADQLKEVRASKSGVTALPFSRFQAKLIDVGAYLECRCSHRFGSIDHPIPGEDASDIRYIEIPILSEGKTEQWNIPTIANSLVAGERFTMLGDYGIGKSMTLREVFRYLRKRYLQQALSCFPLHLNLREHHGQPDPAEIIERHGRIIGYPNPNHLVRAWRAGYVVVILDGFDEVASFGLQGGWKVLRQARWQTVAGVRKLIEQTPHSAGVVVAGRHSFFDSDGERHEALGDSPFHQLLLHEFSEDQISDFFKEVGYSGSIPSWLPARPLLLSTVFWLYSKKRGPSVEPLSLPDDPAEGWSLLIDSIANRESKIEAGVSGSTIKRLLEILATKARATTSGLGPLSTSDVTSAFAQIAGSQPSSEALQVLQRLPGLGVVPNSDDGLRNFLDEDLVDALGASDVANVLIDPYSANDSDPVFLVAKILGSVGSGILNRKLLANGFDAKRVRQTHKELERRQKTTGPFGDLFRFALAYKLTEESQLTISGVEFPDFEITSDVGNLSKVSFQNCFFRRLSIDSSVSRSHIPFFTRCLIEFLEGYISNSDLPLEHFVECDIDQFVDVAETNTAIARSDLPAQIRVLVTIIRKLFVQSLGGRQVAALRRGLDLQDQRYVDDLVSLLLQSNFATQYSTGNGLVIVPVRRQLHRALRIVSSPLGCGDPLIAALSRKFE